MPRPQSVKVFSNATANDSPPRQSGRATARNFGVTFSKTPCFSASALKGSRKLRTAKAIATADKVRQLSLIDIDAQRMKAMFDYYSGRALAMTLGPNGGGPVLGPITRGSGTGVQNRLSDDLYAKGTPGWRFDDYTNMTDAWLGHGRMKGVYNYYSPITSYADTSYFGGYAAMHNCAVGLGTALTDYSNATLAALKNYDTASFDAAVDQFWGDFNNERTYATELRTLGETYARDAFEAEETQALALVEHDITKERRRSETMKKRLDAGIQERHHVSGGVAKLTDEGFGLFEEELIGFDLDLFGHFVVSGH